MINHSLWAMAVSEQIRSTELSLNQLLRMKVSEDSTEKRKQVLDQVDQLAKLFLGTTPELGDKEELTVWRIQTITPFLDNLSNRIAFRKEVKSACDYQTFLCAYYAERIWNNPKNAYDALTRAYLCAPEEDLSRLEKLRDGLPKNPDSTKLLQAFDKEATTGKRKHEEPSPTTGNKKPSL